MKGEILSRKGTERMKPIKKKKKKKHCKRKLNKR